MPNARLEFERDRTTGQLRLFASRSRGGANLDRRHDVPLPDHAPLPRPDLMIAQRPEAIVTATADARTATCLRTNLTDGSRGPTATGVTG